MKNLILFCLLLGATAVNAQIYSSKETFVTFFSDAAIEDIKADNKTSTSLIKGSSSEIAFKVPIQGFSFEQSLMQEHFNEKKYMWSSKHPYATFEGKIEGDYDLSKEGEYEVKAVGTLTIRGVEKQREIEGTLKVDKDGKVKLHTEFSVVLEDHEVPRPSMLFDNIAEQVLVTLDATYELYTPKK